MNLSSKQLNTIDVECTAIKVNNVGNVLHLLQKTLTKLSEVSDLPIKIICDEKNKYLIRQQLNEMNCGTEVFLNGDIANPEPSILFTVTLQ
jgi:mannose-1-phosphate guanylyltransferase